MGNSEPSSGNDDKPFDEVPFDAGVQADENTDPVKYIQQLSGKLGQKLRQYTEKLGQADLELEKFAINSVISATHTSEMDDKDKNDIIKKINSSGEPNAEDVKDNDIDDDFGDDFGGAEEQPTEEAVIREEEGITILPKDHKQVFVNAKLGVEESTKNLVYKKKSSIFGENKELKGLILKKLEETYMNTTETETPEVKPDVVPTKNPETIPTRRQKPWKISPMPSPEPKATK